MNTKTIVATGGHRHLFLVFGNIPGFNFKSFVHDLISRRVVALTESHRKFLARPITTLISERKEIMLASLQIYIRCKQPVVGIVLVAPIVTGTFRIAVIEPCSAVGIGIYNHKI